MRLGLYNVVLKEWEQTMGQQTAQSSPDKVLSTSSISRYVVVALGIVPVGAIMLLHAISSIF